MPKRKRDEVVTLRGGTGEEAVRLRPPRARTQRPPTDTDGTCPPPPECKTPRCRRPATHDSGGRCEQCWAEAAEWWRWHGERPLEISCARARREMEPDRLE